MTKCRNDEVNILYRTAYYYWVLVEQPAYRSSRLEHLYVQLNTEQNVNEYDAML